MDKEVIRQYKKKKLMSYTNDYIMTIWYFMLYQMGINL